jgi:hypothetical protein
LQRMGQQELLLWIVGKIARRHLPTTFTTGNRPQSSKNATNSQAWIKTLIAVSPLRNGLQVEGAIAARIRDGARPSLACGLTLSVVSVNAS